MADLLLTAAKKLGLGIANLGKAGIALALENIDAVANRRIHQLLNPGENILGSLQMVFSMIPVKSVSSKSKYFESKDLTQIDKVIRKYENEIYMQYRKQIDEYWELRKDEKENPDKYLDEGVREQIELKKRNLFKDTDIMNYMTEMGEELNSMEAVTGHKNDLVNFVNLVNTNNPLDLKSRSFVNTRTGLEYNFSIWAAPWPKREGKTFEKDYAGNWLYGYVGDEYFTTPVDDGILKYGAGTAQFLSDLKAVNNKEDLKDYKEVAAKYINSILSGGYGDNLNADGPSDADMIQEGINAHKKSQ